MDSRRYSTSYEDYGRGAPPRQPVAQEPNRSVYRKSYDPTQTYQTRSGIERTTAGQQIPPRDAAYANRMNPQANVYDGSGDHVSRSTSRRRQRNSQGNDNLPPSVNLPPAQSRIPQNTASRVRAPTKAHPPPIQTQQPLRESHRRTQQFSPLSPEDLLQDSPTGSRRRSSAAVQHRSPLQKLEGKLDDISKEEKRARLEEAEHQAQQRSARQHGAYDIPDISTSATVNAKRYPAASTSDPRQAPVPDQRDRRRSSERAGRSTQDHLPVNDPSERYYSSRNPGNAGASRAGVPFRDTNYAAATKERPSVDTGRKAIATGGPGAAALRTREADLANEESVTPTSTKSNGSTPNRSNSRRLQKKPPENYARGQRDPQAMTAAHKQLQSERTGGAQRSALAATARYHEPDPVPAESVKNQSARAPTYDRPPQTAAGQHAREQVGFHSEDQPANAAPAADAHGHHRISNLLHRHHGPERRYEAPKAFDDWKMAGTARLLGADIDLDEPTSTENRQTAWWEQGDSRRRRSSQAYEDQYDGVHEDKDDQLVFRPPLHLKCGPLLRYTGMRREQSSRTSRHATGEREVWRGSVMIVTDDTYSSYEKEPTLRLFVQPKDLLPPPPAQVDDTSGAHLRPEYVDPLAGEPKLSRTGKLVYVKPVEQLDEEVDYSCIEDDQGLFDSVRQTSVPGANQTGPRSQNGSRTKTKRKDGETMRKFREVKGTRLHAERGVTFWRFNLEIELGSEQARIAYRINRGPAIGFWVPGRGQSMNMMFHSCNGFSLSVDPNTFSGPDPLWRDVLNNHQTRPFHVMIGGGDQIYNDRATKDTTLFQEWLAIKNPEHKHSAQFSAEMQDELEDFYLNRYAMWFSQGLFGMANSQIPMVNVWDDHDIIDGYGSYPHHTMSTNVFCGLGEIAFKYYMLFQHQSVVAETTADEPSWLLGASPGPYINELSRSLFMFMGRSVAFLGLDCRTERMRDSILSGESYDLAFDRCKREIIQGETKHLIVLLGVVQPPAMPCKAFANV
jgi:hypothetical protein